MRNAQLIDKCINEIGKAKFSFDKKTNEYLFNNKTPRETPKDYYSKLHNEFNRRLVIQLRERATKDLLEKYIKLTETKIKEIEKIIENLRINYIYSKSVNLIPDTALDSYNDLNYIFSTQSSVLHKIKHKLKNGLEYIDYPTSFDYLNSELDYDTIPFSESDKATFNLSKKESLMLIFLLEEHKIIEFKDEHHRKIFIEYNFQFKELRKNKKEGSILPMKGVGSELSKFKSIAEIISNNKTLENLQEKLKVAIEYFEFKK
nr:hypothetical protein [uncultured Flavobacterium sp.]